jgi:hypothetical protein
MSPTTKKPTPPSLEDLLKQGMSPSAQGKDLETLLVEDLTQEDEGEKLAARTLVEQRAAADAALAAEREQTAYDKSRTSGGDISRGLSLTGSSDVPPPAPTRAAPQLVGTTPGTKAAAAALQTLVEQPETAVAPQRVRENLTPDESTIEEEAGLAFDIAYKAIEQESAAWSWSDLFMAMPSQMLRRGTYQSLKGEDVPGRVAGPISRAYTGVDGGLDQISDPAKKARIQAKVRDILENEGGVEYWQGTDAEDRDSYIDVELLKNMSLGPNMERVVQIRSVMDNATDKQFDASATFGRLNTAYVKDLERAYRAEHPEIQGARMPEEVFAEIKATAAEKARKDIERIKSVTMPHVFLDTGAQDIKEKYLAEGESSALMALKGRTLDPLSVRPSLIDQAYDDSTGAGSALPGLMIGATFLGRALEVLSAQEQGAMQFEVFADNVNERIERAADPNAPTLMETASGVLRGFGQATITAQVGGPFRSEAYAGLFADEGQTPDDFIREADARLIDIATDNRDYFDSVAFTLPVLLTAPFGRDAQAEALTTALDHHLAAKFGALVSAVVLPDSSPLGATAAAARKTVSWAAKGRRFTQTITDLGKIADAVDSAATPQEFVSAAKNVNLAAGQAVEAMLIREEVREQVGGVTSTLAGVGETASGAMKRAKLGPEVEEAQKTLATLRTNKASRETIQAQVAEVDRLIQQRLAQVQGDVAQGGADLRSVEDVLGRAASRSDDDLVDDAAAGVVNEAGAGVDAAKVRTEAAKLLDGDQVKGILEEHPLHMQALERATKFDATAEDLVDAEAALKALGASIKARGELLGRYADSLDTQAKGILERAAGTGAAKEGQEALRALAALRKTVEEIAIWKKRSPEAAKYLDAQMEAVQANARTANALAEVERLKQRSRLIDPQTAAKEQQDLLAEIAKNDSKRLTDAQKAQAAAGEVEDAEWARSKTALDTLRRMTPKDERYPKAQAEYLEAQAKALQAQAKTEAAAADVARLKTLSAQASKEQQENLAKVAALKAATTEGDKVRVLDVGLFRAQEAAAVAQAAEEAARTRVLTARAALPKVDEKQIVALSSKAVETLKTASGKVDVAEAVAELQDKAQRAMFGVNSARSMQAGARAIRAAHDRATRREVIAVSKFLRMRSEKLADPPTMQSVRGVLSAVKYTGEEAGAVKVALISEKEPSIASLVGKLGASVRNQRALGQAVAWRTSARKVVDTMREATAKLSKRDDVSWADLGWRSGEIGKVTAARSAAGAAVERALRSAEENSPGTVEAAAALRAALGQDTETPHLNALALKLDMSTEDVAVNRRTVQVAAQQDLDLAVQKIMSAEETVALAAMQTAWTEKSFKYQMKMFMDPMTSYIGTSSQGLRNVYRGVVGTTQMYFVGLNGVVRKAAEEIKAAAGGEGGLPPKEAFNVLMKNIDTFIGTANTVSDRGAAVAQVSIFERAKRSLITDAPAQKDGVPVVDAVTGVDRDLLQAQRDAAVAFPGGMTGAEVEKVKAKNAVAVAQAEKELESLRTKEALLRAQVAKLSAPDPKAVEAPDIASMVEARLALADQQKQAQAAVDRLKAADPLDFFDESPMGKRVGEMEAAKADIATLSKELQDAKNEVDALAKVLEKERAARDEINATTLGAKKIRQVPDDENLVLTKDMRDRLANTSKKEAAALEALDDVEMAAREKAYATPEVIREVAEATRLAKEVDARLAAARAALAELPETPAPGTNSTALRAQRTRRSSVVSKFEKEAADLQERIENAVVARAKSLLENDAGLKAKHQKAKGTWSQAQERAKAARTARDEALAKAKSAPVLASPDEVKAAKKVVQDRIDALEASEVAAARDTLAKVKKNIADKQKKVDAVYEKYSKELGDDAAKKTLLEAIKKQKVAKAEEAATEATRVLREESARVDKVIREADAAILGSEAREVERVAKAADLVAASEAVAAAEAKALRAKEEVTNFLERVKAARESSEFAAREAAIGGARVDVARRAAAAEVGQKDPDQTLVRLGMAVTRGVQFAEESVSADKMPLMAEAVAREALASSDSFEEMYSKIIGLWIEKYGAIGATLGQDAKSMAFAAAAMIEGASRDLAIEGTLREGIGMVDPLAAKAMERISRISSGGMKAADLTSADVQAALVGFAKMGQIWNRTVEGKGVKTAVAGGAEKSDRDLGMFLASVRDVKVDNQTIYLPRALAEALSSEMDLMRKEVDALPAQNPNTLMNMWLVDTTRDVMRFVRTSRLVGYLINPLGYRFRTLAGDTEQVYYAVGGKEALQNLALAPLQMVPFKGAVVVDAAHSGAGKLGGAVKAGINMVAASSLPQKVKDAVARVGNPLADLIRGTYNADIGKVMSSVASDPREKFTFGGVSKTRAEWIEEAARQGAFDTNVEAGMRKSVRDVRNMITEVTSRRMTWADAVEAGKERGESPFKLYMLRQRVPLKEDDISSKPGLASRLAAGAVEHQRALEAREADVQRTTRQALYFRLRDQGLTENETGEAMRRGLLDWSHGLNRSVAGVLAYMPFWRYHTLSFGQGFNMLLGGKGGRFDRYAKTLRAYNGLYEGTPEEEEIALVKERARAVARSAGRSEEAADLEVSTFLAARQFAIGAVPKFLRDSGQAYSVEHVSGVNFSDLGSGAWQRETGKVDQARRDHRDSGSKATAWKANAVLRSSAVGSIDAIATMSLLMEAAYYAADGDMVASEGAVLKAGTPYIGRMPDPMARMVEDAILARSPVANAAFGGQRVYSDYGRVTPAEADLAEMLGIPLTSTQDDPRPQAPWWFKWMVSLPVMEVPVPVVGQIRDAYKAGTYSNPEMYGDSTFKRVMHTPLAMWGAMRSYDFDPVYNRGLENAARNRAAQEVVKQAEQGTQLYRTK